jgi:hypothetical protein
VDAKSRELIGKKLGRLIDGYDGSDRQAKEILRGLVAAQKMGMNLREFAEALKKIGGTLDAA